MTETDPVANTFSRQAEAYDEQAVLQRDVASRMSASLEPWLMTLPPGPLLEIGAGTGFLTRELIRLMPSRELIATDISDRMLQICRRKFNTQDLHGLTFEQIDAEKFNPGQKKYALITSNFAAQWFRDPALTLGRYCEALRPEGLLLFSFPGSDSFPEWREAALELGLPFTANSLPDTEEMVIKLSMGPAQVDYFEEPYRTEWPDALSFFRHLKRIGASESLHEKRLTTKQFRLLCRHLDEKSGNDSVSITWHLVFLAVKRDS